MDHQYLCETITNSVMQYLGTFIQFEQSRSDAFWFLGDEIDHTKMPDIDRKNIRAAYRACGEFGAGTDLEPVRQLQRLLSSYDRTTKIGLLIWAYVHWSNIELDADYAKANPE